MEAVLEMGAGGLEGESEPGDGDGDGDGQSSCDHDYNFGAKREPVSILQI